MSIMTLGPTVNNDRLFLTLILSAMAHFLVISAIKLPPPPEAKEEIALTFVTPDLVFPQPTRQIVSTPDNPSEIKPPDSTALLSEKNSTAKKEMIKRGDNPAGENGERTPQPASQPGAAEPRPPTPSKKPLLLRNENLLAKFVTQPQRPTTNSDSTPQSPTREFSRAPGSGAAFYGVTGVPDYLPNLPDGDLTLLNTKAVQYAVFVQRVATRVFGEMRQAGWELLRAADIRQIDSPAMVEAVIDSAGNLVSVSLKTSSGSSRFDGVLREAVRKGVPDRNPPESAAHDDGNIHFLFQSRSWVRPIITQSGAPTEQRWLLLGTGLR